MSTLKKPITRSYVKGNNIQLFDTEIRLKKSLKKNDSLFEIFNIKIEC